MYEALLKHMGKYLVKKKVFSDESICQGYTLESNPKIPLSHFGGAQGQKSECTTFSSRFRVLANDSTFQRISHNFLKIPRNFQENLTQFLGKFCTIFK